MQTRPAGSKFKVTKGSQNEAVCLMVYSEKTHVEYIYPLLSQLEDILEEKGFKPKRLGDEIRNSEDYLETLESMVEDCSLALIVLDGFRPNVLFEFGYLKGKKKPIIVLQSRDAQINIKTLYRDTDDSGLTPTQFHRRLSNPKLDVSFHLSDFAGKHVTKIDWRLKETDPLHPSRVLPNEIRKKREEIIAETVRIRTKNFSENQEKELVKPIIEIASLYYSEKSSVSVKRIETLYSRIRNLTKTQNLKPPIEIYGMISSILERKIVATKGGSEAVSCLAYIQQINNDIIEAISPKKNRALFANTLMRKGHISLRLFNQNYKKEHCYEAIRVYRRVLKVYDCQKTKRECAKAHNGIAEAYSYLSQIQNPIANCQKAIQERDESLKLLNPEEHQLEYITTQVDRMIVYFNLAEVDPKIENLEKVAEEIEKLLKLGKLRLLLYGLYGVIQNLLAATYSSLAYAKKKKELYPRAFEAYEEALKDTTLQKSPVAYAELQSHLATSYGELAQLENKPENCKKAIAALTEVMKVYTLERFPLDYASAKTNLCEIYRRLAEAEDKVVNCNKAIEVCKEALREQVCKISPLQCAESQSNLGSVYSTLAEAENPRENYGKAIEVYNQVLATREFKLLPKKLARTLKKLGNAYHNLAKITSETNDYKNAVKAYTKALRIYVKLGNKEDIESTEKSLRDLSEILDANTVDARKKATN